MFSSDRVRLIAIFAAAFAALTASSAEAQNHAPNPYETLEDYAPLPDGRSWGSTSAVETSPDGETILGHRPLRSEQLRHGCSGALGA